MTSILKKSFALSAALHTAVIGGVLYKDLPDTQKTREQEQTTTLQKDIPSPAQTVRISGQITPESAQNFTDTFVLSATDASRTPGSVITVALNTSGGRVDAGYNIMSVIRESSLPKKILCEKQAASMGAILLITTQGQNREATQDCKITIHAPYRILLQNGIEHKIDHDYFELLRQEIKLTPAIKYWGFNSAKNDQDTSKFTRGQIVQALEEHDKIVAKFALAIAHNSRLTVEDAQYMLNQGDVNFSPIEAQYLGFIDQIQDYSFTAYDELFAHLSICNDDKLPFLSLCNRTP
jgi:ATP-dependent protease ClpP protease subunit